MSLAGVVVIASVGVVALAVHSLRVWGRWRTLAFYGTALGWMTYRGIHAVGEGAAGALAEGPRLFGVHPFVPLGWTFTFALAWHLSEPVVRRTRGSDDRILPVLALSVVGVLCTAYLVETTAVALRWREGISGTVVEGRPLEAAVMRIFVWGWQAVVFFSAVSVLGWRALEGVWARLVTAPLVALALLLLSTFLPASRTWVPASLPVMLVAAALLDGPRFDAATRVGRSTVLPYLAFGLLLGVCGGLHVVVAGEPRLLLAAIPLSVFAAVSWLCRRDRS